MDGGATPLRNADFKKLLMTPRPAAEMTPRPGMMPALGGKRSFGHSSHEEKKHKPPTKEKIHKQQFHKEGAPEKQKSKIITAPSGQKYRDRAAERRDGGTIVTEDGAVIDEASLLGLEEADPLLPTPANVVASLVDTASSRMVLGVNINREEDEETRRNRVKGGLDFALLQKARQQAERSHLHRGEEEEEEEKVKKNLSIEELQERAEIEKRKLEMSSQPKPFFKPPPPKIASIVTEKTIVPPSKPAETRKMGQTSIGKATLWIIDHWEKEKAHKEAKRNAKIVPTDRFLPGRISFVFNTVNLENAMIDPDSLSHNDIPTTVITSKDDLPPVEESMLFQVDVGLVERIQECLAELGSKKKKKKTKTTTAAKAPSAEEGSISQAQVVLKPINKTPTPQKKPQAPPAPVVPMEPDDDDIFMDAGRDYVAKREDQPKTSSYDVPIPGPSMLGPQMPGPGAMQGPAMPSSYDDEEPEYDFSDDSAFAHLEEEKTSKPTMKYFQSQEDEAEEEDEKQRLASADDLLKQITQMGEKVLLQQKMKEAAEKLKQIGGADASGARFHAKDVKEAKKVLPDEYTECYAAAYEDNVGGPRKSALSRMVYGDEPEEEEKDADSKTVEFFATAGLDSRKRAARPWDKEEGNAKKGADKEKDKKKRMTRDAKINRDYNKINELMKKKGGDKKSGGDQ